MLKVTIIYKSIDYDHSLLTKEKEFTIPNVHVNHYNEAQLFELEQYLNSIPGLRVHISHED